MSAPAGLITDSDGEWLGTLLERSPSAEADAEWHLDHSRRRYRVRAWREGDGVPALYRWPCITIVDFARGTICAGVPATMTALPRWEDTDAYAEARLRWECDAVRLLRGAR